MEGYKGEFSTEVTVDVDIDVDEIICDISDYDIAQEYKNRELEGKTIAHDRSWNISKEVDADAEIDIVDFVNELDDEVIKEEYEIRGFNAIKLNYISLCDYFGVNHFTSKDELIGKVRAILNEEKI